MIELGPITERWDLDLVLIGRRTTPRPCCATPRSAARAASASSPTRASSSPSRTGPSSAGSSTARTTSSPTSTSPTSPRPRPGGARTRSTAGSRPGSSPAARTAPTSAPGARSPSMFPSPVTSSGSTPRGRRRLPGRLPHRAGRRPRHERCAQMGSVLAAYVLETVGTQEYTVTTRGLPGPVRRGLRGRGHGRDRPARAHDAPDTDHPAMTCSHRSSRRPSARGTSSTHGPTPARTSSRPGCRPRTRHPARGLPQRALPHGVGHRMAPGPIGWWSPTREVSCLPGALKVRQESCASSIGASTSGSTPPSTRWWPTAPTRIP
jgi:hypothetical protein